MRKIREKLIKSFFFRFRDGADITFEVIMNSGKIYCVIVTQSFCSFVLFEISILI